MEMKFYIGLAAPLLLYVYLPLAAIGLLVLFAKVESWKTRRWAIPLYLVLAYAIPIYTLPKMGMALLFQPF